MVNVSLNTLLSAALLLVSLGAVTAAPAPEPVIIPQGDPRLPSGSTQCGPFKFSQILSAGSGGQPAYTWIPKGCCFVVPAGNTVPDISKCKTKNKGN
ncbi:MAG: hypothetical protein M1813_008468 [Trichoglossum hirsutum]|nr:MAG: hypothetical protein M1813_008468 [Trichoglossum hirsutum]